MTRHVQAAGGVLWRRVDGEVRVALVHRPHYDDWSLPKGKLDPGELHVVGAVREVAEETGFTAAVGRTLTESRYRVLERGREVPKTVRWWSMRATGGAFVASTEVDEMLWLDLDAALRHVDADRDGPALRAFAAHPPDTTTLLLVRHASAGSRADWSGEDDARPLDARGLEQATALARVLPAYAPGRVLSAPVLRCVETVRPLAERLGLPVGLDPSLSEHAHRHDPDAAVEALQQAVAGQDGGPAVVACSQGGVIPHAVRTLLGLAGATAPSVVTDLTAARDPSAARDPAAAGPAGRIEGAAIGARKGSVWALTFSRGVLVDADHAVSLLPRTT